MAPRLGLGGGVTANPASGLFANLLLDDYPDAMFAYSVRKLSNDYSGYAMKVRESDGDEEADVGFDAAGTISLSSPIANETGGSGPTLGDFVDAGGDDNGAYVTTWYDQSGNGRNATNTTDAYQPHIVVSGAINTQNSKPAIDFNLRGGDSTKVNLSNTGWATVSQPFTLTVVATADESGGSSNQQLLDGDDSTSSNRVILGFLFGASLMQGAYAGSTKYLVAPADSANTDQQHWFAVYNGDPPDSLMSFNGSDVVDPEAGLPSSQVWGLHTNAMEGFRLGARYSQTYGWKGDVQEFVGWPSSQLANQAGLTANSNSYFSIY